MERVLNSGPELAEHPLAMNAPPNAPCLGASARSTGAAPARIGATAPNVASLFPLAYHLAVATVLATVGFPGWRIGVLLLAGALQKLNCATMRAHAPRLCVNAGAAQMARFAVLSQTSLLLTTGASSAVTGGIESPLLPTLLCAYFAAVAGAGDRRETRFLLGATALVACALAALPRTFTGPELGSTVHGILAAVGVVGVGALLSPVLAGMRRKHDELTRAREEIASDALNRARSLEQIGAKVAHELKNPLTGVKALVQLGLRNPAEAPSRERLEVVEKEVTRMQEILQNYLSFTRPLQTVTPTRVELGPLVSDTLLVLSARADDARVRLFARGDATVDADPRRIKEALLNLVANAIEATPPGGEVVVEVALVGDEAEIVVRDTGRGMPAETLRRIGTPFFTTRVDGTGLGVVLARSVISQHGGSLRYESEPGKGTRVRVALPRVASGARDVASAAGR
jgi:signal transduction histidine kinase